MGGGEKPVPPGPMVQTRGGTHEGIPTQCPLLFVPGPTTPQSRWLPLGLAAAPVYCQRAADNFRPESVQDAGLARSSSKANAQQHNPDRTELLECGPGGEDPLLPGRLHPLLKFQAFCPAPSLHPHHSKDYPCHARCEDCYQAFGGGLVRQF